MNVRLGFGLMALMLASCGPSQQWVKPGATEADLRSTITLCDRETRHFNREGIAHLARRMKPSNQETIAEVEGT